MKHREFFLYFAVGIGMTLFNWTVYSVLIAFLPMFFANAFSWGLTTFATFFMDKVIVFKSRNFDKVLVIREFISFVTARGVTGALEVFMQPQLYELGLNQALFGVEGLEAKITVTVVLSLLNYLSSKLLVFRGGLKRMESI